MQIKSQINQKEKENKTADFAPTIQSAIQELQKPSSDSPVMIHSSQKPAEKPPLTKGKLHIL